jgi:hypothetical protein
MLHNTHEISTEETTKVETIHESKSYDAVEEAATPADPSTSPPGEHNKSPLEEKQPPILLQAAMVGSSASALSCIINLTNTVAGTGMLGLPGAYAGSGWFVGTLLLFIASLFSANGLRLLALSAEKVGVSKEQPSSFYVIANAALPDFTLAIDLAVAFKCFGVATGYFITVGGTKEIFLFDTLEGIVDFFHLKHSHHFFLQIAW